MQEVASSTQTHAAHARAHGARHGKPQGGSDFAAMLDEMVPDPSDAPAEPNAPVPKAAPETQVQTAGNANTKTADNGKTADDVVKAAPSAEVQSPATPKGEDQTSLLWPKLPAVAGVAVKAANVDSGDKSDKQVKAASQPGDKPQAASPDAPTPSAPTAQAANTVANVLTAVTSVTSPAPAPAQPDMQPDIQPVAIGTPPQAGDMPALSPALALLTAAAQQKAADPKPGQRPAEAAQPDTDDQAGVPQTPEAPAGDATSLLPNGKPAAPAAAVAAKAANAPAPDHRPSVGVAAKGTDTAATADDLLNASAATSSAAPGGNAGVSATGHTSSASPAAAAASGSASQPQLAPVPLSGIPVLIAGKALAGSNHFDIRLDPPELGRIEVRLKVDRDGQVSSHLIADRADTLALLRRDQTGLERALQDAGLKTSGDGLQFSLRDQSGNGQPDGRSPSPTLVVQDNANLTTDLLPRGYTSYAARVGGIDIHV